MNLWQQFEKRGFRPEGSAFRTARPDQQTFPLITERGDPVVAKLYSNDNGKATYTNMRELWRSSFGKDRNPPGLPEPLVYDSALRALIMRRVPGRPLAEFTLLEDEILEQTALLLASLHDSNARAARVRNSRRIVKSIRRKSAMIGRVNPSLESSYAKVTERLEQEQPEDRELVPSHGDFSPRNVLVSSGQLLIIDWDRFQLADPARDISYFGVWCWMSALRNKQQSGWHVLQRISESYNAYRPQACINKRLRFHMAAGLLRIAASFVKLWPLQVYLVPTLIEHADDLLKGAPVLS